MIPHNETDNSQFYNIIFAKNPLWLLLCCFVQFVRFTILLLHFIGAFIFVIIKYIKYWKCVLLKTSYDLTKESDLFAKFCLVLYARRLVFNLPMALIFIIMSKKPRSRCKRYTYSQKTNTFRYINIRLSLPLQNWTRGHPVTVSKPVNVFCALQSADKKPQMSLHAKIV